MAWCKSKAMGFLVFFSDWNRTIENWSFPAYFSFRTTTSHSNFPTSSTFKTGFPAALNSAGRVWVVLGLSIKTFKMSPWFSFLKATLASPHDWVHPQPLKSSTWMGSYVSLTGLAPYFHS